MLSRTETLSVVVTEGFWFSLDAGGVVVVAVRLTVELSHEIHLHLFVITGGIVGD